MKHTIITALLAIICITNLQAQENNRSIKDKGVRVKPSHPTKKGIKEGGMLSIGIGTSMPSTDAKKNSYLTNSMGITANVFLPVIKFPSANIGFNLGGTYDIGGKANTTATLPKPYDIKGHTSSNVVYKGTNPTQSGFKTAIGPQANFFVGKHFVISPMVPIGYINLSQKTISVVQTTSFNGQNYDFNLATLPENKIKGVTVNPTLRFNYFVSKNIGLWVEGNYMTGPKVQTQITTLIPNGVADPKEGTYDLKSLQNGTFVKGEINTTSYKATCFSAGLVIKMGKKKDNGNTNKRGIKENGMKRNGLRTSMNMSVGKQKTSQETFNEKDKNEEIASESGIKIGGATEMPNKQNLQDPDAVCGCCSELMGLEHRIFHEAKCNNNVVLKYENDYVISDEKILAHLNTKEFEIKKGIYEPNYSKNLFGDIILNLVKPLTIKDATKDYSLKVFGGFRCDTSCKNEGNYCFTCKKTATTSLFFQFTLTPIIKNGQAEQIILSNKAVSIKEGNNSNNNDTYKTACPEGLYPNGSNCYPCLGCHPCGTSYCDNLTNSIINTPISSLDVIDLIDRFESGSSLTKTISKKDLQRLIIENSENPDQKAKVKCNCGSMVYGKDAAACERICDFLGGAGGY